MASLEEITRHDRKVAGERLLTAWAVAIVPNTVDAFGVDLNGGWLIVRIVLSVVFTIALVAWIVAMWREKHGPPQRVGAVRLFAAVTCLSSGAGRAVRTVGQHVAADRLLELRLGWKRADAYADDVGVAVKEDRRGEPAVGAQSA